MDARAILSTTNGESMKHCPQCSTGYPDSFAACPTHGLPLNEIRDLKPGMVIHHSYRIVRKLGQGGMGAVYLAQHTLMDEPRALKFLSAELSQDQAFTARFLREVRTLRQIRHPNVVDCGDLESAEDGSLFFSMEFVDGPDLRAFLRDAPKYFESGSGGDTEGGGGFNPRIYQPITERALAPEEIGVKGTGFSPYMEANRSDGVLTPAGALPVELALHLTRQIAHGLAAAHARGMVHRDIKPENILLARDGSGWQPKIADFGIVATKESSSVFTRTGGTLLTVAYAAPEQWRGTAAAELDGRTDLYALGGLLYEMLTGQTAFHAESYEGWAHQQQVTPPPPPSALRPELANWQGLDVLVQRLLAKDREDRPKDVAELLGLLDAVRYTSPDAQRETELDTTASSVSQEYTMKTSKPARRWGIWLGLLAGGLILAAIAVWFTSQRPKQPTNSAVQTPLVQHEKEMPQTRQPQPAIIANFSPTNPTPNTPQGPKPAQVEVQKPSAQQSSIAEIDKQAVAFYDQKRFSDAAPLYNQACAGGLGGDCTRLGSMYEKGEGVGQNNSQAVSLYSKGCVTGSAGGCDNLVLLYKKGGTSAEDSTRVVALFSNACDAGNANGCASLGFMYEIGVGVGRDTSRAATLYSKACDAGDARGCLNLGSMYGTGNGVARDYSRSAMLSSKACDGGEALGCFNLGLGYENGLGVKRDYSEAATLYSKACDAGIALGCGRLGILYVNGTGVVKDSTRAANLFSKSCDGGIAMGCLNLGIFNETGNGVAKDYTRAATFYSKACNAGSARGCANLGSLYEYGEGVAKNYLESATLYSKACDNGDAGGCSNLGNLYLNGWGVGKDAGKAKEFLNKGCSMGNQFGCDRLKQVQ
jgi:TPR repeat protein/tRNA A-37 threonylcarbamoyl transferase component Bud32